MTRIKMVIQVRPPPLAPQDDGDDQDDDDDLDDDNDDEPHPKATPKSHPCRNPGNFEKFLGADRT